MSQTASALSLVVDNSATLGNKLYIDTTPAYGGGGGGPVDPTVPMREYVDKADEAVESRLSAKLDSLTTKLDSLATKDGVSLQRTSVVHNVWAGVAALLLAGLAILSFGADRFDGGASISPQIAALETHQLTVDAAQDHRVKAVDQKLDVIIKQTAK